MRIAVRFILSLGLLACSSSVAAQQLRIHPTTLLVAPTENAAALTLENHGNKAEHYQVQVYAWTQSKDGRDVTSLTKDLLAAPSVIEVPPGGRRVIRVIRLKGQGTTAYYRLFLRQLPKPRSPGKNGMQVLLNQNLPLAFQPKDSSQPVLSARYTSKGLLLHNRSAIAARLTSIGPAGRANWREGMLGWVLPSQDKLVSLKPAQRATTVSLTVNGQQLTVDTR